MSSPRTLHELETFLKATPSTRVRLFAAAVALINGAKAGAHEGPGQYVRCPKKEFADFYWLVRECEGAGR